MARKNDAPTGPSTRPPATTSPERGAGGEDYTRAIAGNIIQSWRLVQGPVEGHDRNAMIAEAAYYRAERRGFAPGGELDDWLAAEREIDERSGKGAIG